MVDRSGSLLGSQYHKLEVEHNLLNEQSKGSYHQVIRSVNIHANNMKKIIVQYQKSVTPQQQNDRIQTFKRQQQALRNNRQNLFTQLKKMPQNEDDPQYQFVKKQLVKATQNQMNMQIQLNEKVNNKKLRLQQLQTQLKIGSPKLQNTLNDILQKRQQIIYLQQSVKECLQLFQAIHIIVTDNTKKLQVTGQYLKKANQDIERAIVNIDKAVINQKRCRRKMCLGILLAAIIIALIVGIYFGFSYGN